MKSLPLIDIVKNVLALLAVWHMILASKNSFFLFDLLFECSVRISRVSVDS